MLNAKCNVKTIRNQSGVVSVTRPGSNVVVTQKSSMVQEATKFKHRNSWQRQTWAHIASNKATVMCEESKKIAGLKETPSTRR